MTVFREESGAVGLSGRDLPAAQALAGHASVLARAKQYETSGAFPGKNGSALQALAYLHLLNGVTAGDAIAFARNATAEPPDGPGLAEDGGSEDPGGEDGSGDVPGGSRGGGPGDERTGRDPDDSQGPGGGGNGPEDSRGVRGGRENPGGGHTSYRGDRPDGGLRPGDGDGSPENSSGGVGPGGPAGPCAPLTAHRVLPEVTVPLATLHGRAERPGENRLLGALDPALARDLAAAAARSDHSRWEVTVVDGRGYAIGHGVARPGRGRRQEPQPPGPDSCTLPARVTITVTETCLRRLAAQAQPLSGVPPGDWTLAPLNGSGAGAGQAGQGEDAPGGYGAWSLTLHGGRELTVRFDVVPTHACDHRYQVSSYEPGGRLRRLVQVRDRECTFPTCSRPAYESDFEHAVPYHQGGATCACNAGARSRRCHQVKQAAGWNVSQPRPGWHLWTTPTGRTYLQEPWRYTA